MVVFHDPDLFQDHCKRQNLHIGSFGWLAIPVNLQKVHRYPN